MDARAGYRLPATLIWAFLTLSIILLTRKLVYTFYLHGLRHVPGPKINALSRLPHVRHLLSGTVHHQVRDLHERHGEVVRVSPNQISLTSIETAFTDVYGFRTGTKKGHQSLAKDPVWYPRPVNGADSILIANDEAHSRGRRLLAHALSDKTLMQQEPLLQKYADQLVDRLGEMLSKGSKPFDMVHWYNWTTFDIMADLLFGEPFGCLQDMATHKYVELLGEAVKGFSIAYVLHHLPWVKWFGRLIVDTSVTQRRKEYQDWVAAQARKRMQREDSRPDFMTHIVAHNGEKGLKLSQLEIESNCSLFLSAGSETTATLLSAATYLLLRNPAKYQKLKDEVRTKFQTHDQITIEAVTHAPYLLAVFAEALRYFPPVPLGFERRVGPGGEMVSGYFMPEGTSLAVSHYVAYHSERNFRDPDDFVPERWMGDARYADDKRAWCQPFSFGPRNCLGKNLAYAEMRLILAKIVWSFDMELEPESEDWMSRCRIRALWQKPRLAVRLAEVARD